MFEWMFRRQEHWSGSGYSFAVAFADGNPIGQLGGVPFHFNRFGESGTGIWTANWSIKPEARKGATAIELLLEFQRRDMQLVMLFGMNPMLHPIMKGIKYHTVESLPRFWIVFEDRREEFRRLMAQSYPDWSQSRIDQLTRRLTVLPPVSARPDVVRNIPRDWDDTTWKILSGRMVGAARTAEYLQWRYAEHPVYDYRFVTIENDDGPGLAVWRREEIEQKAANNLGAVGRIMEILAPTSRCAQSLIGCLCADLWASDVFAADYMGYSGEAGEALLGSGFKLVETETDGAMIPCRFQPIDTKMTTLHSAISLLGDGPDSKYDANCPWIWTKGDGDMDRP